MIALPALIPLIYALTVEFGRSLLFPITLITSLVSVASETGEIIVMFLRSPLAAAFHTIIVVSPLIFSLIISDTLSINVPDFLIINPFEYV